jgi:xanthine dehydrogenase accessory factor
MDVFTAASEAWRTSRPAALATVIAVGGSAPRSSGARMLVYEDGSTVGSIGGGNVELQVIRVAQRAIASGQPVRFQANLTRDLGMCCGGQMEVFVEPLQVREPLVLFGAGHISLALAPLLRDLSFAVTVVDERPEFATRERFPGCEIHSGDPREYANALQGDPAAYWLIFTHDHGLDQDIGEILLPKPCAWIGMIGSRTKIAKFLLRYKAADMDPALFKKLCAPVGLDIGAETPAEIAVAIAAELVRVRHRTTRVPIPLSEIPIPARGGDGIAVAPAMAGLKVEEGDG